MNVILHPTQPWRGFALLTASVLLAAAACNSRPAAPQSNEENAKNEQLPKENIFLNVTAQSGVDLTYKNGEWLDLKKDHYAIPESLGGGGGAADFFGTGRMDLIICGGGYYDRTHAEYIAD